MKSDSTKREGKGSPRWTFLVIRFIHCQFYPKLPNNYSLFTICDFPISVLHLILRSSDFHAILSAIRKPTACSGLKCCSSNNTHFSILGFK